MMVTVVAALAAGASDLSDPVATPASIVASGSCARFTMLTERLVRMESSASAGNFDERASFAVINRRLPEPAFHVRRNATATVISTADLRLTHTHGGSSSACSSTGFAPGEVEVALLVPPHSTWRSGQIAPPADRPSSVARIMPDAANLNGTMNEGPSFAGGLDCYSHPPECEQRYRQVIGQGLLSRAGFTLVNDTNNTRLIPSPPPTIGAPVLTWQWFDPPSTRTSNHVDAEDLYILASGLEYERALSDWAAISGPPSLPPLAALGVWYSRYFPYGSASYAKDVIGEYKSHSLPLSVGVLDVPWHNIDYAISDLGPDKNGSYPYPNHQGTAGPGRGCNGWDGFTFNRTLFPDPASFFGSVHQEGIKMILSVHMQNGIDHCQEQSPWLPPWATVRR